MKQLLPIPSLKVALTMCFLFVAIPFHSAHHASAQISRVGSDALFDVATWNIEWFGAANNGPNNDNLQVQNVKDILEGSEIELWAVQEISSTTRFDELLAALAPGWQGELATQSGSQRVGYIWNTKFVSKRSSTHILTSFSDDFAGRPPLKAEFDVTLADTTLRVTLINVHMKAFGDAESYQKRVNASERVKNHIDFSSLGTASVIFLGDFNDGLTASTYANQVSPYANFLQDAANYQALTLELENKNEYTWIGGSPGSSLDHIIISSELSGSYLSGSVSTMKGLRSLFGFTAQTSDHLPVYASFGSSTALDTDETDLPVAFMVRDIYPNPSSGTSQVTISASKYSAVDIRVYDALGRLLSTKTHQVVAGDHTLPVPVQHLVPGAYFVQINSGYSQTTRPLMIVR